MAIKNSLPDFEITYSPDFRQAIANSWPSSIDDTYAKKDWNWEHHYNLETMTAEMITQLKLRYS